MTSEAWRGDVGVGVRAWAGEPPPDPVAEGPDADPESVARKILLDALTGQARSRHDLRQRLAKKQVPDDLAERLLDRFTEVGLVDDAAFARSWVESRQRSRGLARRALAQELRRKGVDDETARAALDEVDPDDEEAAARELVRKKLRSMRGVDAHHRDPAAGGHARPQGLLPGALVRRGPRRARRARRRIRHDGAVNPHLHRLSPGAVDLSAIPTDASPGFDGGKTKGKAALFALGDELSDLQERLWAEKTTGSPRRVLLVLQGMDTSGKGGVLRHTVGLVDPQGVKITSFKAPTDEERQPPLPVADPQRTAPPGLPRGLRPVPLRGRADRPGPRPGRSPHGGEQIRPDQRRSRPSSPPQGVVIVKCMLHISAAEQRARLLARLDNEDKYWKFNPGDIDERRAVERLPVGLRGGPRAHQHRDRALVRRTVRQEVVSQPGDRPAPARPPARHGPDAGRRPTSTSRSSASACSTRARCDRHRRGHPLRHPAARGRQPAGAGRGRRPRHLRLQVPRRRPGGARAGRRGDRQRPGGPARPAHAPAGGPRARPADRPLRGRRGGAGPPQRQPRAQPGHRLPAGRVRLRGRDLDCQPTSPRGCSGSTPSPPTSTAPGATPTSCCGTTTCGSSTTAPSLYFHHGWSGGVGDPARFAQQPWDVRDHVFGAHLDLLPGGRRLGLG